MLQVHCGRSRSTAIATGIMKETTQSPKGQGLDSGRVRHLERRGGVLLLELPLTGPPAHGMVKADDAALRALDPDVFVFAYTHSSLEVTISMIKQQGCYVWLQCPEGTTSTLMQKTELPSMMQCQFCHQCAPEEAHLEEQSGPGQPYF